MAGSSKFLDALTWTQVELSRIVELHPSVAAHRQRADVVDGTTLDLAGWSADAIDVLQAACPPLLVARRTATDIHYQIVAGAQIVAAMRRVVPPSATTRALLLPLWLRSDRLVGVSAAWELGAAAVHARRDAASLLRLYRDSCSAGFNPLNAPPSRTAFQNATRLRPLRP